MNYGLNFRTLTSWALQYEPIVLPGAYKSDMDITSLLEARAVSDSQSTSANFKEAPAEEQVAYPCPTFLIAWKGKYEERRGGNLLRLFHS